VSVVFGSTGEPPDADPHVRWCGRGWANPGPYPICERSYAPWAWTARKQSEQ
jgi:hypothetical protein